MHRDANADLECLFEEDPDAAAEIAVLIQEIAGSQELLEALSIPHHIDDKIDVGLFVTLQKRRLNVWRLKAGYLEAAWAKYRLIYAFDGPKGAYHVLSIMHRGQNYERDTTFIARLERAYNDLGLPQLPRY